MNNSWYYEDRLPDGYPYDLMAGRSRLVDGVRMFPPLLSDQQKASLFHLASQRLRIAVQELRKCQELIETATDEYETAWLSCIPEQIHDEAKHIEEFVKSYEA